MADANSFINCIIRFERPWDSALQSGHVYCVFCLHTMTPASTVQCPVCRKRPEKQALKLRTDFPESLLTTTAIADIRPSQSVTTTDATPTVTSNANPTDEPGPSSENIVVVATGPEVESNSDVTDFINDNGQGEAPNSNNDETVAEEIYNNEDSPDIIFNSCTIYDPSLGLTSVNHFL